MKKLKITMITIIAVLFSCVLLMGCIDGNSDDDNTKENPIPPVNNPAQGKVLILQAYGNAGGNSPAGVSHSFVELYNKSDDAIDLSGISLYFANGKSGADVTEDEAWQSIALTGTIPAKGSFLILGKKHDDVTSTRYKIADNYGDINDDSLSLNRRGFKVAIIKSTEALTDQNPFISNNGKPISGYIDMVGAVNDTTKDDHIFGYEEAPARCSASEAVRRQDLTDMDNNSTDFIAARYALTGDGAFSNEMLEVRKPRNSSAEEWNPFAAPTEPPAPPEPPDTTDVDYTKLKLNEISGVGDDPEKFYELKNLGNKDIPLFNCKIYYNANGAIGGSLPAGKGNVTWTGTTSQTIEAGKLFSLIGRDNPLGTNPGSFTTGLTAGRILIITLEDPEGNVIDKCVRSRDTGDYASTDKSFSRIPDGTGDFYFTTPTPNVTNGVSTAGLKKLPKDPPIISNLSREPSSVTSTDTVTVSATVTKDESETTITTVVLEWTLDGAAQSNIDMTASGNVYSADIEAKAVGSVVTYKVSATNNLGETTVTNPQNYTVVSAPLPILLIFQAGASTNGAVSHNFVELYNAGDVDADLTGYSLQYANGGTTDGAWIVINLSGTLPKHCSFLILGNKWSGTRSDTAKYGDITDNSGDINASFSLSNNGFKVVLMSNTTQLTVPNPFDTDGLGTKATGYIDMLGAVNGTSQPLHGFETAVMTKISKQQTARRINLDDTDNNNNDFINIDYRTTGNVQEFQYPRTKTYGAWNPITGTKE